jgi:signal peptidase I
MGEEDLPIGPTLLAPGAKEPSDLGHRIAQKILVPLVVLFGVVIIVFYVLFDFGRVSGPSMLPTLRNEDRVLLTKGDPYPRHGDIVITSVDEQGEQVELVKRVIAVPGDMISIEGDRALVNGVPEPERGQVVVPEYASSAPTFTVPPKMVYLMGDNRAVSFDSRWLGPEPIAGIKGKVVAIYSPVTRIRLVR